MIFKGRYDKAMERMREKNSSATGKDPNSDAEFRPEIDLEDNMEKGDMKALILSGLLVIVPVALGVLLLLAAIGYFFMMR